jgi:putative methyltransferase
VHDLLLNKRGISAPASHPLRLSVEKHKARLAAEFTKARLKRGYTSIDALRASLQVDGADAKNGAHTANGATGSAPARQWPHPRWVRVNTLKTNLDEQLKTTFASHKALNSLEILISSPRSPTEKVLHIDKHIPNLVALPAATELSKTARYLDGLIILQDKASCFPAYILDPKADEGGFLDACAAPGNKTTHLAAIVNDSGSSKLKPIIYACEKDQLRALTLKQMVRITGAGDCVTIKAGQDFLRVNPDKPPWNEVRALLLDPSCSGSGIIGRDEALRVVLPSRDNSIIVPANGSKKRKRRTQIDPTPVLGVKSKDVPMSEDKASDQLSVRLTALSTFQLKLLLHAFQFPEARKIAYSTCSIYAQENEHVVMKALASSLAKEKSWRILWRTEQVSGMKAWEIRGDIQACKAADSDNVEDVDHIAEACLRCEKGTNEGTQGFFVAAFVRDDDRRPVEKLVDEEWEGFSDAECSG